MRFETNRGEAVRTGMEDAHNLVAHLRSGGSLIPVATGLRLEPGETAFVRTQVQAARYCSRPGTPYPRTTLLGLGSLGALTVTAVGSAVWNSHQRRRAERQSAAQWRPTGWTDTVVTSGRLLLRHEGCWTSIWFPHIIELQPWPDGQRLDLLVHEGPALRIEGPSLPLVTVMLFYLLHHQEVALPELRC